MFIGKDLFTNTKSKHPNPTTEMHDWASENVPGLDAAFLKACNSTWLVLKRLFSKAVIDFFGKEDGCAFGRVPS